MKGKLERPDLVMGYMKKSIRQKVYPFLVGFTVVLIIILLAVMECV